MPQLPPDLQVTAREASRQGVGELVGDGRYEFRPKMQPQVTQDDLELSELAHHKPASRGKRVNCVYDGPGVDVKSKSTCPRRTTSVPREPMSKSLIAFSSW